MFLFLLLFFRQPTRPSLTLKKESFESLRLPLAKGSSTSNQAFLLRRKDVNRPPVLGTAALYGWRTIKGLRQIVRDGTALMQGFLYLTLSLIYMNQQKEKTSYIYYCLLINFAANSKKSATFLKSSNCWQYILA